MSTNFTLEIVARGRWGDGPNEIPLALENYLRFGEMTPEQMRKVRAPVRIRLGPADSIHALSDAALRSPGGGPVFIHHFNPEGDIIRKTPVLFLNRSPTDELTILDYAVDAAGNSYLLERLCSGPSNQPSNRLRKIKPDGETEWSRMGPVSEPEFNFNLLKGSFTKLLMDGRSRLFLPATKDEGAVAEIDPATGAVMHVFAFDKFSDMIFMNDEGRVICILYFPEVNRRGVGSSNLQDQTLKYFVGGVEHYDLLLHSFGVDASSNVYVARTSAIDRISMEGKIDLLAVFDNIVVRSSDDAIFSSCLVSDNQESLIVRVERHSPRSLSQRLELHLPEDISARHRHMWKLIDVDQQERYTIFGGEEPGRVGTLLVYSQKGDLESRTVPSPGLFPTESILEDRSFWEVDARGRIYLPVIDSEGLKVIRLSS